MYNEPFPDKNRVENSLLSWGLGSNGSRSKNFYPGGVNFLLLGSGWVGSAIFGLGLVLENFP